MAIFIFQDYSEPNGPRRQAPQAGHAQVPARTGALPPVPQIMETELTSRQMAVFRQMLAYQEQHGQPPTQAELSALLGMKSGQGVKAHLTVLEAKGFVVSTQKNGHRSKLAVWPDAT